MSLPGGDGEQASASLSAQVADVKRRERCSSFSYRIDYGPKSFVYKYAGEQEIKERGRGGAPRESDAGGGEEGESRRGDGVICDTVVATTVSPS